MDWLVDYKLFILIDKNGEKNQRKSDKIMYQIYNKQIENICRTEAIDNEEKKQRMEII